MRERERGRERGGGGRKQETEQLRGKERDGRKRNIVNTTYQSVFGSSITNRV